MEWGTDGMIVSHLPLKESSSLLTRLVFFTAYYSRFGGYGPHGRIVLGHQDCLGGCPMQAFCDYGICRCREGYDARFGQCYKQFGSVYDGRRSEFDRRTGPGFNPYKPCDGHDECRFIDMNMVCAANATCACRRDMRWNREVGECQLFMVREKGFGLSKRSIYSYYFFF